MVLTNAPFFCCCCVNKLFITHRSFFCTLSIREYWTKKKSIIPFWHIGAKQNKRNSPIIFFYFASDCFPWIPVNKFLNIFWICFYSSTFLHQHEQWIWWELQNIQNPVFLPYYWHCFCILVLVHFTYLSDAGGRK